MSQRNSIEQRLEHCTQGPIVKSENARKIIQTNPQTQSAKAEKNIINITTTHTLTYAIMKFL